MKYTTLIYCYAINLALILFRLADLSLEFELEKPPGIADLMSVIVNHEDVAGIICRPVSTYEIF